MCREEWITCDQIPVGELLEEYLAKCELTWVGSTEKYIVVPKKVIEAAQPSKPAEKQQEQPKVVEPVVEPVAALPAVVVSVPPVEEPKDKEAEATAVTPEAPTTVVKPSAEVPTPGNDAPAK